eukprot:1156815-Pelagomonas_calceolata.AAC.9
MAACLRVHESGGCEASRLAAHSTKGGRRAEEERADVQNHAPSRSTDQRGRDKYLDWKKRPVQMGKQQGTFDK